MYVFTVYAKLCTLVPEAAETYGDPGVLQRHLCICLLSFA